LRRFVSGVIFLYLAFDCRERAGEEEKNAEEHEIVAVTKRGGKRAWGVASKQIHGNITQCPGTRPEQ